MKRLFHLLRGTVTLVVTGVELEYFLNCCAKENLHFWAVDRREAFTLALTVYRREASKITQLGQRCHCTVTEERQYGLPFFFLRFRKRYALLAGVAVCFLAVSICSNFIFVIDIQGVQSVPKGVILSHLRQFGLKPGTYGPKVDSRELSHQMLLAMEELSFFSVNVHGTRAEVIVREAAPKPPLVDEVTPTNVVSTATGIITHMEVEKGAPMFKEGETVMEGEVLISGLIDIQEAAYSNADLGTSLVHAQGRAWARTWRTHEAKIPLTAKVKEPTGEEKSRYALNFLGKRVKFYRNGGISFSMYDKITTTKTWVLGDGSILPFSFEKESFRQYDTREVALEEEGAEAMLKEQLQKALAEEIGPEGEILRQDYVVRKVDGFLEVTLLAECSEQIGKLVAYEQPPMENPLEAPNPAQS
jgi:similar to stage IV sporulation protein